MRRLITAGLFALVACSPASPPADPTGTGPAVAAPTAADPARPDDAPAPATPPPTPGAVAADAAPPAALAARLRGRVSYPSEELPAMRVCAIATGDPGLGYCTDTAVNVPHYEVTLPGGTWWLLAWPQATGTVGDPGLLSAASDCLATGGTGCDDHTLLEVTVDSGEVREGLDINDWYYDPRETPPPMEPRGEPPPE